MKKQQQINLKIKYSRCPIYQYYSAILTGRIKVSRKVKLVYQYLYRIIATHDFCYYDELAAYRAIDFIEKFCKQSKDPFAGQPVHLLLFQRALIAAIFGVINKRTGERHFKELLLVMARKNGKSTLCSAICSYMLYADGERGAEIYSAATQSVQAKIVWSETKKMILKSPVLASVSKCQRDAIYYGDSVFRPLGRDSKSFDGFNSSLVIIDEIHAITDDELYGLLKQSQATRKKALLIMITTAGFSRDHLYDKKYDESEIILREMAAGTYTGTILPIIYELDNWKAEIGDKSCWIKANPSIGKIKSYDYLHDQIEAAQRSGDYNTVLTKDFDVPRLSAQAFFQAAELQNKETFDVGKVFGNTYCIVGMDLSKAYDLTSLCFITRRSGRWYVHSQNWMPTKTYESKVTEESKIPWQKWKEQGLLRLCEGSKINYHDIFDYIRNFSKENHSTIYKMGYDSWSAQYFAEELENYLGRGVLLPIIQGYKTLSQPLQLLRADFADNKVVYNNNELLRWCCCNVKVVEDRNGNMMPDKSAKRLKIDAFAALLDAYAVFTTISDDFIKITDRKDKQ